MTITVALPAPETKTIKESTTDSESGVFHKGEHEKCFAYVFNTACDRHNFVLDFTVGIPWFKRHGKDHTIRMLVGLSGISEGDVHIGGLSIKTNFFS